MDDGYPTPAHIECFHHGDGIAEFQNLRNDAQFPRGDGQISPAIAQQALQILRQSAPRDVGHGMDTHFLFAQRPDFFVIQPGRRQQLEHLLPGHFFAELLQTLADQRPAVAVKSNRRPTHHHIARSNFGNIQQIFFFHRPHRKSRQLNHPIRHDTRHFRRLAPRQNTMTRRTPLRRPRHQPRDLLLLNPPDADVIKKHHRITPGRQDIVDVHRHKILPGRLQKIILEQYLKLRSHPVCPRHNHRVLVLAQIIGRGKQPKGIRELTVLLRAGHQ